MIRTVHVDLLREQVEQARKDLAGWEQLLAQAEQQARAGQLLPDPLMPVGAPWPVERRQPYPDHTTVMPAIDGTQLPPVQEGAATLSGSRLPRQQEAALMGFNATHDAYAETGEARDEEQKWQKS